MCAPALCWRSAEGARDRPSICARLFAPTGEAGTVKRRRCRPPVALRLAAARRPTPAWHRPAHRRRRANQREALLRQRMTAGIGHGPKSSNRAADRAHVAGISALSRDVDLTPASRPPARGRVSRLGSRADPRSPTGPAGCHHHRPGSQADPHSPTVPAADPPMPRSRWRRSRGSAPTRQQPSVSLVSWSLPLV
jgi:hypothetical protein